MRMAPLNIGCSIQDAYAAKASTPEIKTLKDLLYRNRLIVLKDQSLDEQQYCEFAHRFGSPVPYLQDNYHHPDFPLIFVSSNVKKDGKQIGVPRTGGYWHSDTSFEAEPKFITMLMPKVLPKTVARSTRFIDMAEVYAALPRRPRTGSPAPSSCTAAACASRSAPTASASTSSRSSTLIDQARRPSRTRRDRAPLHARRRCSTATAASPSASPTGRSTSPPSLLARDLRLRRERPLRPRGAWSMGDIIIWDNRFLRTPPGATPGRRRRP